MGRSKAKSVHNAQLRYEVASGHIFKSITIELAKGVGATRASQGLALVDFQIIS